MKETGPVVAWRTRYIGQEQKSPKVSFQVTREPKLLYVFFWGASPSGRCSAETVNFLLLLMVSYYFPIMIGGAGLQQHQMLIRGFEKCSGNQCHSSM